MAADRLICPGGRLSFFGELGLWGQDRTRHAVRIITTQEKTGKEAAASRNEKPMKEITLETVQGGIIIDLFNEQLEKVMANIADDNMPVDAVRKIKIVLAIKPDKTRSIATTKVSVSSELPAGRPYDGMCFLAPGEGGKLKACEDDYRQKELEDSSGNTIFTMPKAKEN